MDSPRGRIYLMKMASEGTAEMNAKWVSHFDSCLGCMACMTACPSGVDYGKLIEATRAQIERNFTRPSGRVNVSNRSEEHTSELQSLTNLVCRLLLEKKKISKANKLYINSNAINRK